MVDIFPLSFCRGIEDALQDLVEPLDAQASPPHGGQDLDVLRSAAHIAGQHLPDQLDGVLVDDRDLVPLQEKEIPALVVHEQLVSLQDPVGVHDNIALTGLAEDMVEHDGPEGTGFDQVLQDTAGAHAGQLVDVADQDQPGADRDRLQQRVEKIHVHHGHLIDNDDIRLERVTLIALKPGGFTPQRLLCIRAVQSVVLPGAADTQHAVDGPGRITGRLRHSPRGTPGRSCQQDFLIFSHKKADQSVDGGGLAGAGAARDHQDRVFGRLQDRLPLQGVEGDPLFFFKS